MRILVYPHATGIGGSQLNAVEIAGAVRDLGHDVLVVSRTGPLTQTIERLGLPHVLLDSRAERRPSARAVAQLTELASARRRDVVHGYEWPPAIECFAGPRLRLGLPAVCTIMSMAVAPFLPRTIPLIVGTSQIKARALRAGHKDVTLLEPPVDCRANAPGAPGSDPAAFASAHRRPGVPLVVIVSRLAAELKLEGLLAARDAAAALTMTRTPLRLVIVGDGQARPQVEQAAALANARAGRDVVTLAGLMRDPRPAYAAADIVVGMGGSALRAMSFAKPVIVQGEHGFCELVAPQTAPIFGRQGFFGLGPPEHGRREAAARLAEILRGLLGRTGQLAGRERLAELGRYGRSLVVARYSLDHAARTQAAVYERAASVCAGATTLDLATDAASAGIGVARYKAVRKWQQWHGTAAIDDFNTVSAMRG